MRCTGAADWTDPVWRIETMDDMRFCASMLDLEGVLCALNPHYPDPAVDLTLAASVQSVTEGITTTGSAAVSQRLVHIR
jgi:hypothetical protein